MAVKQYEIVYNGGDLTETGEILDAFGRPFSFRVPAGTIKRVKLWSRRGQPNAAGDNVFNLNKNGVALYAGTERPKIAQNAESGQISELADEVVEGDELSLSLETMADGGVKAPIVLLVEIDDGEETGGGGAAPSGLLDPPKTPNDFDDEFDGNALDAGKWTEAGSATIKSFNDKIRSGYFFRFDANSGITLDQLLAPGSADFSITLCAQMETRENYNNVSLMVFDDDESDSVECQYIFADSLKFATSKKVSGAYSYDIGNFAVSAPQLFPYQFIHIQRVGGNWKTFCSNNGVVWSPLLTGLSHAFTVAKARIQISRGTGATAKIQGVLHWIRKDWMFLEQ